MKYKKGDVVVGKVTGIAKYGIFMVLDNNQNGMVHISEMSYDFVKDIHEYVNIGDEIEVRIIDDTDSSKLQLSMKDISDIRVNTRSQYINETRHGFSTLRKNLPLWISEKLKKMKKM